MSTTNRPGADIDSADDSDEDIKSGGISQSANVKMDNSKLRYVGARGGGKLLSSEKGRHSAQVGCNGVLHTGTDDKAIIACAVKDLFEDSQHAIYSSTLACGRTCEREAEDLRDVKSLNRLLVNLQRPPLVLKMHQMIECEEGGFFFPARVSGVDEVTCSVSHFGLDSMVWKRSLSLFT